MERMIVPEMEEDPSKESEAPGTEIEPKETSFYKNLQDF